MDYTPSNENDMKPETTRDTTSDSPAVDQLFEQAVLDAMGVLEHDELEEFEQAWRDAPVELKRQLVRQQAFLTDLQDLLPEVDPPAVLRERVLVSVRRAMEEASASRSGGAARRSVTHGSGEASRAVSGRTAAPGSSLFRGRRVHHLWRAVALGLAVAVVGLGTLQTYMARQISRARDVAAFGVIIDELGPEHVYDFLMDPNTERLALTPTAAAGDATAVLWRSADGESGRVIASGLKASNGGYRVVALDDRGRIERQLAELQADGAFSSATVPMISAGLRLAILPPEGQGDDPLFTLDA
ncbi:MAG: hypothetical protein AAGI17_04075 [Planctomycetota bacterium]